MAVFYRFLSTNTAGDFFIPRDQTGEKTHTPDFYGVNVASAVAPGGLANGLGTEAFDLKTAEQVLATRSVLFYGVVAGTGSLTSTLRVEDSTTTILPDVEDKLPPIFYQNSTHSDGFIIQGMKTFKLPWPIIFETGFLGTNTGTDQIRILLRARNQVR